MKVINTNVEVISEGEEDLYLHLNFTQVDEDNGRKYTYNIPRLKLSNLKVNIDRTPYVNNPTFIQNEECSIKFDVEKDCNGKFYDIKVIEEPIEVTMEDIERKYGRPVKIIK